MPRKNKRAKTVKFDPSGAGPSTQSTTGGAGNKPNKSKPSASLATIANTLASQPKGCVRRLPSDYPAEVPSYRDGTGLIVALKKRSAPGFEEGRAKAVSKLLLQNFAFLIVNKITTA